MAEIHDYGDSHSHVIQIEVDVKDDDRASSSRVADIGWHSHGIGSMNVEGSAGGSPPAETHNNSGSDSHVIDIDIGAKGEQYRAGGGGCAVCMEPLEWVAVGRRGHRNVCSACAVCIRFVYGDRRCCICRTCCPAVVITNSGDTGAPMLSALPPAAGEGPVGKFWYHEGAAAYFDNKQHYMAMKSVSRIQRKASMHWYQPLVCFILVMAGAYLFGTGAGAALALVAAEGWLDWVAAMLLIPLGTTLLAFMFWFIAKFPDPE